MPEKEARPPAQNRHGGAPRGERVPLDARRASPGTVPSRAEKARQRKYAPFGAPPVPHWADGKETSKTRAQKCAAGTKKTALFDMVNRNDAATCPVPPSARTAASRDEALVSRPSARLGADFAHSGGTRARAGTQGDTMRRGNPILRFALLALGPGSRFASLHSPGTRGRGRASARRRDRATATSASLSRRPVRRRCVRSRGRGAAPP